VNSPETASQTRQGVPAGVAGTGSAAAGLLGASGSVTSDDRAQMLGHRAITVWLTGLSGSGKSTLAYAAEAELAAAGVLACVLDGDRLRTGLCSDLGFSEHDRSENIRRAGEVCGLLRAAGAVVLASFISPFRRDRALVRAAHPDGCFVEVFVDAPLHVCESRDPKGLYAKARAGEIADFTGIGARYEPPTDPDLRVDTASSDAAACTGVVVAEVMRRVC